MKPSSFCTMCSFNKSNELVGLLLSLSIHHTNENIYVISDSKTKDLIENITPKPRLNIVWIIENDTSIKKIKIIDYALEFEKDTLFLDTNTIIMDIIEDIDVTKDLGILTNYNDGSILWTKNRNLLNDLENITTIEQLLQKYNYFEFPENYNLNFSKTINESTFEEKIAHNITSVPNDLIYFKNKPVKLIHTYFTDKELLFFNNYMSRHIFNAKMYKILAIIYRVINNKWIIKIPQQPMSGLGFHKNDGYRQLAVLFKINNEDVELIYQNETHHCCIEPNILTYDRTTLQWINEDILNSSLFLLGNGDVNKEGKHLTEQINTLGIKLNIKPWIFWPEKPIVVEKLLKNENIKTYEDRIIETIFIGNIENNSPWKNVLTEYHHIENHNDNDKFTYLEYLMKLRNCKYGLCLPDYGSKCYREIELMAFGTVLIVTPEVSTKSYMEPLIENTHYILVKNPEELKEKVSIIPEKKWKVMSNACFEWYQRNVHSKNSWNNMISKILYDFDIKKDKIVFFGTSVTGQPNGYVDKCIHIFNKYHLKKVSFGGMHLNNAGCFFMDEVLKFKPKYCFVDFFVTSYLETNSATKLYLDNIIFTFKKHNIFPIFLILPRIDINENKKKRQDFFNLCIEHCKMYNSEVIDLRYLLNEYDISYFLKDEVHTTNLGAELYANVLIKHFEQIEMKSIENVKYPPKNDLLNFKKIIFHKNEMIDQFILKGNGKILSIFQTIGPHSGNVDIIHHNGKIEKSKKWDKHCFYERNHFNIHNIEVVNNVTIKINTDVIEYELCGNKNINWGEYKKCLKPRIIYYIGDLELMY